jgi:ParB family transcriptional regulator, chromosome partitioning protein
VTNTVRLMKLPQRIQSGLEQGRITEGHARALLGFESEAHQLAVYDQIIDRGLTVRDVERAAKPRAEQPTAKPLKPEPLKDPNWQALEEALSIYLGSQVRLQKGEIGGKMIVDFYSDEDLERILGVLGISL